MTGRVRSTTERRPADGQFHEILVPAVGILDGISNQAIDQSDNSFPPAHNFDQDRGFPFEFSKLKLICAAETANAINTKSIWFRGRNSPGVHRPPAKSVPNTHAKCQEGDYAWKSWSVRSVSNRNARCSSNADTALRAATPQLPGDGISRCIIRQRWNSWSLHTDADGDALIR